jgi:hypothetical protein
MALMGGLLWLASQGHVWARDLVAAAGPLFILAAGILAAIVVTDHEDIAGRSGIVAGVAILAMARFGIVPEATILTLGPWALVVMGAVIGVSGLGIRGRRLLVVRPMSEDRRCRPPGNGEHQERARVGTREEQ